MPLVTRQRSHRRITGTVSVVGRPVALPYWYSGAVASASIMEQAGVLRPMRR